MYQQFNNSKKNKIFFYNLLIITKISAIIVQKLIKSDTGYRGLMPPPKSGILNL